MIIDSMQARILEVFDDIVVDTYNFNFENVAKADLIYRQHSDGSAVIFKNRFTSEEGNVLAERLFELKQMAVKLAEQSTHQHVYVVSSPIDTVEVCLSCDASRPCPTLYESERFKRRPFPEDAK